MRARLSDEQFTALRQFDTCTIANAIETFSVRLRNEGFTDGRVRAIFPQLGTMLGYAATVRIRCSNPPPLPVRAYEERTDWWNYLLTIPAPRVVVIEDLDDNPGCGAFLGDVHAAILKTLDCVGVVTNGTVRDVPAIERLGFPLFAQGLAVSHAYVHIVDFGQPVQVAGLAVAPGDLLHGDGHGVLSVPLEIAPQIPAVAQRLMAREQNVLALCRAPEFSLEKLREAVREVFD